MGGEVSRKRVFGAYGIPVSADPWQDPIDWTDLVDMRANSLSGDVWARVGELVLALRDTGVTVNGS